MSIPPEETIKYHISKQFSQGKVQPALAHLELLPCGHQNNLKLRDPITKELVNKAGICPKGDWPVKKEVPYVAPPPEYVSSP